MAFEDLHNGLLDALIVDRPMASSFIGGNYYDLKVVGGEFAKEDYAIAVCKDKKDLVNKLNYGIWFLRLDGTLTSLTNKWINNGQ